MNAETQGQPWQAPGTASISPVTETTKEPAAREPRRRKKANAPAKPPKEKKPRKAKQVAAPIEPTPAKITKPRKAKSVPKKAAKKTRASKSGSSPEMIRIFAEMKPEDAKPLSALIDIITPLGKKPRERIFNALDKLFP